MKATMSAYDEILAYNSKSKFNDFRQSLVHSRGTLSGGVFADSMGIQYDTPVNETEGDTDSDNDTTVSKTPKKIFLRLRRTPEPGVVFDENGTDRALSNIANGGKLKLLDEFCNYLKFSSQEEKENWLESERPIKRRCLARNLEDLNKKTDIYYRTHGDRLHYFVVGLVTIKIAKNTGKFPLFLFPCTEINKNLLEAEVETTGFVNFWLDKNWLESNLLRTLGKYEVHANDTFASTLNSITNKINSLQLSTLDEIHVDPNYSGVSIVTGFEPEYIDPAWDKILEGNL
jgi:hypothetical protein